MPTTVVTGFEHPVNRTASPQDDAWLGPVVKPMGSINKTVIFLSLSRSNFNWGGGKGYFFTNQL